ncbi:MAG: DUF6261 family protein [Prevotellaceae bacterium]|jgi:Mn-containing catalase|nr:DUF6261 family protein [Prevotellaceae bacterium]
MKKKILNYKQTLFRIPVAQNVQTLFAVYTDAKPLAITVPQLQFVFGGFESELLALDAYFKQSNKAFETAEIVRLDACRDFTARAVIAKVDYAYDFALSDEEREEARRLLYVVEKYRKVEQMEYEAETANLRSMTTELQQLPELLNTFGLTNLIVRLKQENENFEARYNSRAQTVNDKRQQGNALKYRTAANRAFDSFADVLESLRLMPISVEQLATVEQIIDIVNGHIRQATIVYNRHIGVVSARKQNGDTDTADTADETEVQN